MRTKARRLNDDKEEKRAQVAMAKLGKHFAPMQEQADYFRSVLDGFEAELAAIRSGKRVSGQILRDGHESPASHVPVAQHLGDAEASESRTGLAEPVEGLALPPEGS